MGKKHGGAASKSYGDSENPAILALCWLKW